VRGEKLKTIQLDIELHEIVGLWLRVLDWPRWHGYIGLW